MRAADLANDALDAAQTAFLIGDNTYALSILLDALAKIAKRSLSLQILPPVA